MEPVIGLMKREWELDFPDSGKYLAIGIEMVVGRILTMQDGNSSALVQGRRRVEVIEVLEDGPFPRRTCQYY